MWKSAIASQSVAFVVMYTNNKYFHENVTPVEILLTHNQRKSAQYN